MTHCYADDKLFLKQRLRNSFLLSVILADKEKRLSHNLFFARAGRYRKRALIKEYQIDIVN